MKVVVSNMPDNAKRYVVAKVVENELWYWDSWVEPKEANAAADELYKDYDVNAIVVDTEA